MLPETAALKTPSSSPLPLCPPARRLSGRTRKIFSLPHSLSHSRRCTWLSFIHPPPPLASSYLVHRHHRPPPSLRSFLGPARNYPDHLGCSLVRTHARALVLLLFSRFIICQSGRGRAFAFYDFSSEINAAEASLSLEREIALARYGGGPRRDWNRSRERERERARETERWYKQVLRACIVSAGGVCGGSWKRILIGALKWWKARALPGSCFFSPARGSRTYRQ